MPGIVFDEESKISLCFEIGQRQQKCWRKPKVQSLHNQFSCSLKYVRSSQKQQLVHISQTKQRQGKETGNIFVLVSRNTLRGHSVAHPPWRRSITAIGVRSYTWSLMTVPCLFTTWSGRTMGGRRPQRAPEHRKTPIPPDRTVPFRPKMSLWFCFFRLWKGGVLFGPRFPPSAENGARFPDVPRQIFMWCGCGVWGARTRENKFS